MDIVFYPRDDLPLEVTVRSGNREGITAVSVSELSVMVVNEMESQLMIRRFEWRQGSRINVVVCSSGATFERDGTRILLD